mmetsp:Transcript_2326/g.1376  ORF Transcript_2326/g.1376 Transcript_2326/m.1376 type:complete len:93 (+) Transcript_2326:96-374(+)
MIRINNIAIAAAIASISLTQAFIPRATNTHQTTTNTAHLKGYLDNYTAELYTKDNTPEIRDDHLDTDGKNTSEKDCNGSNSREGYGEFFFLI